MVKKVIFAFLTFQKKNINTIVCLLKLKRNENAFQAFQMTQIQCLGSKFYFQLLAIVFRNLNKI